MKISVIGLGYVGSVTTACLAEVGHEVIGVDSNSKKVAMIQAGKSPIIEPELENLISKNVLRGNLRATSNIDEAINNSDISFICVGTPSQKNNSLDLQYIKSCCEEIGAVLKNKNEHHIIVCRSTVFPGSTRKVIIPILESFSGKKCGLDFSVCVNPEFMMEGSAVHDFFNPRRIQKPSATNV